MIYLDADDELAPDAAEAMLDHCSNADAVYGTIESATFDGVTKVRSTRTRRDRERRSVGGSVRVAPSQYIGLHVPAVRADPCWTMG